MIKVLVIICLAVTAAVAGRYLYNSHQEEQRRDAMIKEDEGNKRTLAESSRRVSEDTRKLLRESREKH